MTPAERAMARTVPWLLGGCATALPLLAVPRTSDHLATSTWHLIGVVTLGLGLTASLLALADDSWFQGSGLGPLKRNWASAIVVIVLATGAVGLVTLATGAALRLEPSLQFLQILSALDIAWVSAAAMIGAYRIRGVSAAWTAGIVVAVFCVWAIYRYLDIVGFTQAGGWLVDGGEIARLVLPYDMAAAVVSVALLALGTARQRTAQASPKS